MVGDGTAWWERNPWAWIISGLLTAAVLAMVFCLFSAPWGPMVMTAISVVVFLVGGTWVVRTAIKILGGGFDGEAH